MAPRANERGYLKLSLVSRAVALSPQRAPGTGSASLRGNQPRARASQLVAATAIGARNAALAGSYYKAFQHCIKTCTPLKPQVQKPEKNSQAKSFEEKLATARFFAQ